MAVTPTGREDFEAMVVRAKEAAAAYYDSSELVITDAEYDAMTAAIEVAVVQHPDWDDEGVSSRVAAGQSKGGEVTHPRPMMSLAKAKTEAELAAFLTGSRSRVLVEPKLDGLAVRAVYSSGQLTLVATRGDGYTGEEVTAQAQTVSGLPTKLSQKVDLEVRGEVYMTEDDFDTSNTNRTASGKPAFVNPRNATAGTLRAQDREYLAPMSFAAYEVDGEVDSYLARLSQVRELGIQVAVDLVPGAELIAPNFAEVKLRIDEIGEQRSRLGFPIDGAVVKVDSTSERERLGLTSHAPKWAVAFKYAADTATTVLKDIELAIGRTGRLSLRAVLEPVFVGGATVTYATLHHPGFVQDADLRLGDTVFVYRAGDVIPRVTAPHLPARPQGAVVWEPPVNCPQCGEVLDRSSLLWRCETPSCSVVGRIRYFASRDVMDVEGLDVAISEALVEAGLIQGIADIYNLTLAQLTEVQVGIAPSGKPRLVGVTVAAKLIGGIERSKQQPLHRVITSFGIRGVGRSMGRRLAARFGSLVALRAAGAAELADVDGIGSVKAEMLKKGLDEMSDTIDRLIAAGVQTESTSHQDSSGTRPLEGKKVVVTGTVPGLTRTQAQEAVEKLGGASSSSVSAGTDLVVVGDGAGSKADKAVKLGVTVMEAAEFARLVAAN